MSGEPRISYVVGRLDRAISREIAKRVAPLTVAQYTALSVIRARDGLSNAQLARRTYVTSQSMNAVVMRLEKDGLIRRSRDPGHGRVMRSELTPAGHEVLRRCDESVDELEATMLGGVPRRQREEFMRLLVLSVQNLGAGLTDL